jgi:hypothetical protein
MRTARLLHTVCSTFPKTNVAFPKTNVAFPKTNVASKNVLESIAYVLLHATQKKILLATHIFFCAPRISSGDSTCFVISVVRGHQSMVNPSVGRLHICSLDLEKPGILISLPRFFEIIFLLVNGQLIWKRSSLSI